MAKKHARTDAAWRRKARRVRKHIIRAPWDDQARRYFERMSPLANDGLFIPPREPSPVEIRKKAGVTLATRLRTGEG